MKESIQIKVSEFVEFLMNRDSLDYHNALLKAKELIDNRIKLST